MYSISFAQHSSRRPAARIRQSRRKRIRRFERLEDRSLFAAFTVNSLLDTVDVNPGDGVAQDTAGQTTLRAAIMEANALAGNDSINLGPGTYTLTRAGENEDAAATGDLDLVGGGQLTITGAGAAATFIDAEGLADRLFHVRAGVTAHIAGVTLRNGNVQGPSPGTSGGAILNSGILTINNSTVTSSAALTAGGGISNDVGATLTIADSMISGNIVGSGGGISNGGVLTIINSTITNNSASRFFGKGGGIYNSQSGTATIAGSTISSNRATAANAQPEGGGIYNLGAIAISNSTISSNGARAPLPPPSPNETGSGGGIYNQSGTVSLTNSTIIGNSAPGAAGIHNNAEMVIQSSTITGNQGGGGLFGHGGPGGIVNSQNGTISLQNTIVAGNGVRGLGAPDFSGVVVSLGDNLIGDDRSSQGWVASDIRNIDPRLGTFADHGGPTHTVALQPDSPAIDSGNNAGAPATDQRGVRRPRDGNGDGMAVADIGAFELSLEQTHIETANDSATVNEDTANNAINVLVNDTGPAGSTLRVAAVTQGMHGAVVIGPNGAHVLYTPAPNFVGTDTFAYTVTDGMGGAATAMVTVTVVNADTDFQGTAGDDAYFVRRDASGVNVHVFSNATGEGTPIFTRSFATLVFLAFETLAGDDRLIVDLVNGNPVPAGGIQYLGGNHGAAGDRLIVHDMSTATGTYAADRTTSGSGTVTIGGRNITLTGVEPIEFSGLNALTVVTPNARDVLTISSLADGTTQLAGTSEAVPLSPVSFTNVGTFIIDAATNDAGAGDDSLAVSADGVVPGNLGFVQYRSGTGANRLLIETGTARIDSTVATGGTLETTLAAGTQLVTHRFRQTTLAIGNAGRATILPDGTNAATSVLNRLTINDGGTLDINDNALVVDHAGDSPAATIRQKILEGRGGAGIGNATWVGTGITSTAAAQANATAPDTRSVGYAENAQLPLGPYATFRGQAVDATSVLIAYTRSGDANLDGVVDDDDVTIVGATYAPTAAQPNWAMGDFDYNGFVDDDDVTLLGALYEPAAIPWAAPAATLGRATPTAAGPEDRNAVAPVVRPGTVNPIHLDRSGGPTQNRSIIVGPSDVRRHKTGNNPGPPGRYCLSALRASQSQQANVQPVAQAHVVARSPDRAAATIAGLATTRTRAETVSRNHVRGQETRTQSEQFSRALAHDGRALQVCREQFFGEQEFHSKKPGWIGRGVMARPAHP
jgi:hypothetical protein